MQFKDSDIENFWNDGICPARVPFNLRRVLYRKLQMLDAARELVDLLSPPGNRLEKLKGLRQGQYSIRVNNQYRLCFVWDKNEATEVEFCDYHK